MNLEVTVTRDYLSPVLADLAQRRGNIQEIQSRQDSNVVTGFVPLAEIMVGALWLINIFYINCWRNPRDHISTGVDVWRRASQPCTKFEVGSTKMCHQPKWPFLHPEHLFTSTIAGSQPVLLAILFPASLSCCRTGIWAPAEPFTKCWDCGILLKHTPTPGFLSSQYLASFS